VRSPGPLPRLQSRRTSASRSGKYETCFALVDRTAPACRQLLPKRATVGMIMPAPKTFTAAELFRKNLPAPRWSVPGILPEGAAILAGKPKAGKSWLALGLAVAVASGGKALGDVDVRAGEVLYIAAEDTERRLKLRLRLLLHDQPWPEDLHVALEWPRLPEGLKELTAWLASHPRARLVIVDTLQRLRAPMGRGNAYESDYGAVASLKRAADNAHVSMLIVHHVRKLAADDPMETVSGTYGITGGADTIMVLSRVRGTSEANLHIQGRDVEEQTRGLRWNPDLGAWTLSGPSMPAEQRKLFDLLAEAGEPLSPTEVASRQGKNLSAVKVGLWRMAGTGLLSVTSEGHYFVPKRHTGVSHVTVVTRVTPVTELQGLQGLQLHTESLSESALSDNGAKTAADQREGHV
jgi:AAA domain